MQERKEQKSKHRSYKSYKTYRTYNSSKDQHDHCLIPVGYAGEGCLRNGREMIFCYPAPIVTYTPPMIGSLSLRSIRTRIMRSWILTCLGISLMPLAA